MASFLALRGGARPRQTAPQLLALSPPPLPRSTAQLASLNRARDAKASRSASNDESERSPPAPLPKQKARPRAASDEGSDDSDASDEEKESIVHPFNSACEAWRLLHSKRKRGSAVSQHLVATTLSAYFADAISSSEETHSKRLNHAVRVSGLVLTTVRRIVKHYLETHEMLIEDTARRGGGSVSYYGHILPDGMKDEVIAWVQDELNDEEGPLWVTRQGLRQHILDVYSLDMSPKRISKLAAIWGLKWGPIKKTPKGKCSPERMMYRQSYVLQIAAAVLRGDVIPFTDQSFSHLNANNRMSFHVVGAPHAEHAPTGKGKRLCWMHAFDEDGMVCQYYEIPDGEEDDPLYRFGGAVVPELGDIESECATAEMMFAAKEGGDTGDYHGNFNHDIVMKWIRLRLIPALRARYPEWFEWFQQQQAASLKKTKKKVSAPLLKPREISVVFDCAPYHIGFNPSAGESGVLRFNPLKTSRPELVQQLMDLGCEELTVKHTVVSNTSSDKIIELIVTIDDEEKLRRGKNGVVARLPELQAAAHAWLVEHSPRTLMNDVEYELDKHGIRVIWNAPNYPWGDFIEYCWSQGKGYADAKCFKGRNMVQLAEHIHEGLYTAKEARPGASNIKGGNFVLDLETGECESAKKIFQHGFHSLERSNPGLQTIIDDDEALSGTFPNIVCEAKIRDRALRSHLRSCVRWMVRDALDQAEPLESDDDGSSVGTADSDDSGSD